MKDRTRNLKKYIVWLLPVAVAAAIFYFSSQPGDDSSQLSSGFIQTILDAVSRITGVKVADMEHLISILSTPVRKGAHVTEYIVLYLSVAWAMYLSKLRGYRWTLTAMAVTFLYACTDEFHQRFVPGRAGRFTDVMIDCSGALILCILLLVRRKKRIAGAHEKNKQ